MNKTEWTTILSTSGEQTLTIGEKIAHTLEWGTVVLLFGELGAGKTVLCRGIARGFGITEPVTSPSFAVVQEYPLINGHWLYHLDMYRITDERDALSFGIDDYLYSDNGVTLVEWPERIEGLLLNERGQPLKPQDVVPLHIRHVDEHVRQILLPACVASRIEPREM